MPVILLAFPIYSLSFGHIHSWRICSENIHLPLSNLKIDETGNIQICLIFSGRKHDDAGSLQAQKVPRRVTKTRARPGTQALKNICQVCE